MSTRKKRTLSNIKVPTGETEGEIKKKEKIIPAVSNFIQNKKDPVGQAVRGIEFLVDPESCKPWKYHNRDSAWLNPERCSDLISSIQKNGQQFPIIARKLENDPEGKAWEIIAGRRRWFACSYLRKEVRVKALNGDDRECAIVMSLENKDRDDISEFEDAVSYKQQLDGGVFSSQDEMAVSLDLKKSKLSKMLIAAKVQNYKMVMNLFPDITKLKINPIYSLVSLIEKSNDNKQVILKRADKLYQDYVKKGRILTSSVVIKELINSLDASNKTGKKTTKCYHINKKEVLKVQNDSSGNIQFYFLNKNFTTNDLSQLKEIVDGALDEALVAPVS